MITCRLADALPHHRVHQLQQQANDDIQLRKKIDAWLDAGHGQCWLRDPANAAIVEQGFQRFDGERYYLLAWCIMPNHFHVIIETLPDHPVSGIIHSWKSYSAKQINRRLGRAGTVWQREYFDRYIRDGHHLAAATGYIHQNPVKAGLCQAAALWPFSSARFMAKDAGETPALPGTRSGLSNGAN
ncbi:REP-associated tyrosine transposase [Nitrosococcus oceani]|uniref:REP-associated tyrosine transposase n=1 Tax=Nitrosococcus oceani TaxID=1229 RepID=UPI001E4CBF90|nr:transposase [Nitrosococcus oceani]